MGILKDLSPVINDVYQIFLSSIQSKVEKETKVVKKRFTRWLILWTYYVFALLLVLMGLIFLGTALFAFLTVTISVHGAALIVGAIIFVLGTVMTFVVIASLMR